MKINSVQRQYENRFMFYFLSCVPGIGSSTILKMYDYSGNLSDFLYYSESDLQNTGFLSDKQILNLKCRSEEIEQHYKEYEVLCNSDIKFVTIYDPEYPDRLKIISNPPAILFYRGELPADERPSVAIVGSRAPTSYGSSAAAYFAEELADNGVDIISGMARGIDGCAHSGALNTVSGKTYAVMGGGVNIVYPRENISIYENIVENSRGGVLSEVPPGISVRSGNFPMRNRIISGLSDIVIVVEAREKSGSLITADIALEQGRDVMAVPGRITDPMSKGCNNLINMGAMIANSPEDVIKNLNIPFCEKNDKSGKRTIPLAKNEKIVYSTLDSAPKHVEDIVYLTGLPFNQVISILIELEIKGMAVQISSNYFACSFKT